MAHSEREEQPQSVVWISPFVEADQGGNFNRGVLAFDKRTVDMVDEGIEKAIAEARAAGGSEIDEIAAALRFIDTLPD